MKLSPVALSQMNSFRQTRLWHREAGGVLLGRYIMGCRDVVVDEVTIPMTGDWRLPFSFRRSRSRHQQVINARWAVSRGTCQYLGEWHTHPEPIPNPSSIDIADWRRRLRMDRFDGNSLLFIVVGIREVRVWEGTRQGQVLSMLQQDTG
ncbi:MULTISPECIES: Mov34/MPN/PAD-1 family protein [unclassified Corallococcus]|uniref:Mov34/MPN/PAD-1 family protein n=1 Tax=unclassified Corallococcus TaxID=2685029 RepID=UPI001315A79E|nr:MULTISPECIES: Mov34/MPN/PAD-1 family protein [unclassified Corallococcus]